MQYGPRKIDIKLLRLIVRAAPPATPKEIRDKARGLVLRHQPSGHASLYAVAGRGQRKQLCKVSDIVDDTRPQTLRWAIIEARKFQGKSAAGELVSEAKQQKVTLRAFLVGGSTVRCYGEAVRKMEIARLLASLDQLLHRPLNSIVPLDLARWARRKVQDGAKASTILREARMIHAALEKAVEWGALQVNPLSGSIKCVKGRFRIADIALDAVEHRVRYLTADEEQRLRDALKARDTRMREGRASWNAWREVRGLELRPEHRSRFVDYLEPAILVSMHTGLRQSELLQLTWSCVDFRSKVITVRALTAKSGRVRHVPMNAEVIEVLSSYKPKGAQPTDCVFLTSTGMTVASPKTAWGNLMRESEIKNYCWHDLRHTFASRLAMAGVDLLAIKEMLGHSSVVTTEIYAHLQPNRHHEAVARLV